MGKNSSKNSFYLILLVEIIVVFLSSIGFLEKEAVLILTGLLVFYFLFSKIEDSLMLFIVSIPLFTALPFGDFDSMANWRILLAILFLCLFFREKLWKKKFKLFPIEYLTIIFLFIGFLSLFISFDPIVGIKKILFLVNIFLLYIVVRTVVRNKEMFLRTIKAGAAAGIVCLVVGYSQVITVLFAPLYNFWQWWTKNVINLFYGLNLSKLLGVSNTWFSYYEDAPPTLRMFSVFPDSHSFALFVIISLIFFTYLLKKKIYWIPIVLSYLALMFSGSRGIWVSALIPFALIIYLGIKKTKVKPFLIMLIVFALAFPVSSFVLSLSHDAADGTLAFKRAKSITDMDELSVKNRMGIWKASFNSIIKKPVLGVGMGNYPIILDQDVSAAKQGASAHNLYLDVASEIGLLGLIVLLLMFWQILKKSWKTSLIFCFFILWIFVYSLFDVVLLNDKVLLIFMVILGLLYNYESISKHSNI